MPEPIINYLDIQLRNMDYLGKYGANNKQGQFLDSENFYENKEAFNKGFERAFNIASVTLNQTRDQGGKVRTESIQSLFLKLYNSRLQRERAFLDAWLKAHPITDAQKTGEVDRVYKELLAVMPRPTVRMPKGEKSFTYANAFSKFITTLLGVNLNTEDQAIINTLRNDDFAKEIAGLHSNIYTDRVIKNAQSRNISVNHNGQSLVNSYFEDLFNVFYLGETTTGKNGNKISANFNIEENLNLLLKSNADRRIFRQKFKAFLDKYYPEISEKVSVNILSSLRDNAFKGIYQNFKGKKESGKIILHANLNEKGVSEKNEQQLNKMFLETLRKITQVKNSGLLYEDLSIQGVIKLNESWSTANGKFNKELQIKIDNLIDRFNTLGGKKDRRQNKVIQDAITAFSEEYFNWIMSKIQQWNRDISFSADSKKQLRYATLSKMSGVEGWGSKMLKKISAYGPTQVRGLLGEIATAYALQRGAKLNTEITGSLQSSSGTGQLHYDVKAMINKDLTIGFQVKNYKEEKSIRLYKTSIGLGTAAMRRYFNPDDIKNYKWLFANGIFLTHKQGSPRFKDEASLKKKMADSFITAIPYFLRIGDAASGDIDDQINSDIYVVGNHYYPASYLIERAYAATIDEKKLTSKKIFSIEGNFPPYAEKYLSKNRKYGTEFFQKRDKETGQWVATDRLRTKQKIVSSEGNTSYSRDNLVYIDEHTRLTNARINFSGILINFKI